MAGPGQKFTLLVDNELSQDAQYRSFSEIPTHALNWGTTVQFLPGVYEMGTLTSIDNITFEGVGSPLDVVLANVTLASSCANTIVFRNLTLSGNSGIAASTGRSILVEDGSNANVRFREVVFTNGDFAIDNRSRGNFILVDSCQFQTDRGIRSNSINSANIWFSVLNATSNTYFTTLNDAAARPYRVIASAPVSGGNTGNSVKTVTALVS